MMLVEQVRRESRRVISLTLVDPAGGPVRAWEPGAHIDVFLPSGKVRPYSLCGDDEDTSALTIAVLHEPDGRGGSHELHTTASTGTRLHIRGPRNNFSLVPAEHHLLIAGGIGITPVLPMARALERDGRAWHAVYCGHQDDMAFVDELRELHPNRVTIRATDRHGRPDLAALVAGVPTGTAVYCCGPATLLAEVARHCERRTEVSLRTERFTADPAAPPINAGSGHPIDVELAVTGTRIIVPAGRTILDAVRDIRPDLPFSCEEGYCGTCETRVLDGIPEHRDAVLGMVERESNTKMMICVSRAKSDYLVLDL